MPYAVGSQFAIVARIYWVDNGVTYNVTAQVARCRDRVGVKGEGMRPACMPGCLGAWMLLVSVVAAPQRNKGLPHNTHSVQEREKILYSILNQSEI
jgi:hypothetical protein